MIMENKYYLIITPFFPSQSSFRGPFIYDLVNAVKKTGKYKNVIVFKSKKWTDKKEYYYYNGIKVHLFNTINLPSYIFNGCFNKINSFLFLKALKRFDIPIEQIEVAHGHTSSFGSFGLALKRKNPQIITVLHHHDPDPYTIRNGLFSNWRLNLWIRAVINIHLFKHIDWHVCVSNYVKENLISFPSSSINEQYHSYLNKLKKLKIFNLKSPKIKNLYILYNGVDLSKFKKDSLYRHEIFTIGCIGNFVDWKNQITLLQALDVLKKEYKVSDFKMLFIGSGPELKNCKQYTDKNDLQNNVVFYQEVDHTKLNYFYNQLDLFCLPSYFEGFGCVYTEAAACGVPFILTNHQGASEYIIDEEIDRWTIDNPIDASSLAKLIYKFYMYRYSQHYKYSFDINHLVKNFINTIHR